MLLNVKRLFSLALVIMLGLNAKAQIDWNAPVPFDQKFRVGKLENGITYYIRKNVEPKDRAEFYIIQNVGAILEEDNQDGLAHFLEHMSFNGTKNFPKKGILDYFERNGVKFGYDINAYTSLDQTVYNLSNVPTTREGLVDSALLVLHDWSHFLSLEPEEIENERGVIREEWRTRRSPEQRMHIQGLPIVYKDSKYAFRDVIGEIDVINGCSHEALINFYQKWYRPDLQALVIVGDIDVDKIEQRLKSMFADIPASINPAKREYFELPDNVEPLVSVASDPEAMRNMINVYYKYPVVPAEQKNVGYYRNKIVSELMSQMLIARLSEIAQKPNSPYIDAFVLDYNFIRTKNTTRMIALASNEKVVDATMGLIREAERARRFGFSATELDRAKADLITNLESALKEKDKMKNPVFVQQALNNFLTGEPAPGIEFETMFTKAMMETIGIDEVNALAKARITENNMIVSLELSQKEGVTLPTQAEVIEAIKSVKAENIEAYVDDVVSKPLIEKINNPGKVKKVNKNGAFGTVEYTLSNGVKVVFKKTDFKEDQVSMTAFSRGGSSVASDELYPSAIYTSQFIQTCGVGEFSTVALSKALAGKNVSVSPVISEYYEGFSGRSTPADFESMLQLVYLYFTAPRYDEEVANVFLNNMKAMLVNAALNPAVAFNDSIAATVLGHHPRAPYSNVEFLNKVDYKKAFDFYKDRFADASDFVFVFTGNIDHENVKGLIENYLGGLPKIKRKDDAKDNGIRSPKGLVHNYFSKPMETPKTSVCIIYHSETEYNLKNIIIADIIKSVLDNRYTETIREQEGGSYGVGVMTQLNNFPHGELSTLMMFDTDPEKKDKLIGIIHDEINSIKDNGPIDDVFNRAKEYLLKEYDQDIRSNSYWQSVIFQKYKDNFDSHTDYLTTLKSITKNDVKDFVNSTLGKGNIIEVVMSPEVK